MKHALLAGLVLLAGTAAAGAQDYYDGRGDGGPGFDGPPPPDWHRPPPPDWRRPPPPDDDEFGYGPPRWHRPPPRMVCIAPPPPWRHRPVVCPTRPGPPGSPCGCPDARDWGHRDFARW